jgi:Ni/Fe-hydrogenase subunit HybB-like protein
MSIPEKSETELTSRWDCDLPVNNEPVVTVNFIFLAALSVLGLGLAVVRFFSPLGRFSGMNDAYAWGIWKTFNVMTLTALGSGPLGIGIAVWVFNRRQLHVVMRTAALSGFLFYATALVALGFDVGRPWNFWSFLLPWRWNAESAMLEISICMPLYCAAFLAFELIPLVLERLKRTGNDRLRVWVPVIERYVRLVYPFMMAGAYVVPMMHQSSLGGLLLLAGYKIHPLWQTSFLPLLYLLAAGFCGIAFVTLLLLLACSRYERPLDMVVLGELGNLLSWSCFAFLAVRVADLLWRGQFETAIAFDSMSVLFLIETGLILAPAIALRFRGMREAPRSLLQLASMACLGGMLFRFIPTTIAFEPAQRAVYFPSVIELLMSVGYIALGVLAFFLAAKCFAILPGKLEPAQFKFREISLRELVTQLKGRTA